MKILGLVQVGCLALLAGGSSRAAGPIVVHEWGTFTSLQDESGTAIKGINIDDEPVPSFVYDQQAVTIQAQYSKANGSFGLPPYGQLASKAWRLADPAVTMRLETPVLYLYPPKGEKAASVPLLDVQVAFHHGVLSQYYPCADMDLQPRSVNTPLEGMTSHLDWKNVRLGSEAQPVETAEKVWTTPRETSAPLLEVQAPNYTDQGQRKDVAQAEHFLFYRGVGHLDSPLFVTPAPNNPGQLHIFSQRIKLLSDPIARSAANAVCDQAWLTEIRPDGSCAFRTIHSFQGSMSPIQLRTGATIVSTFAANDYSAAHLAELKASMQKALIAEGLYPDEASAMLRTWELSYFKSPGLRFFYIVPRAWTDEVLPLEITGAPTQVTRVMVGRIELVTSEQRAALERLAAGPCPDLASVRKAATEALRKIPQADADAFYRGEKPLTSLAIDIPPLVRDYLSLGRFRDALIVHEEQERPSEALAQFIGYYGLNPSAN